MDGKLYLNGRCVVRELSEEQEQGRDILAWKLFLEFRKKHLLTFEHRDALMERPDAIPDEWKLGYTLFWRESRPGHLEVSAIYLRDNETWDFVYNLPEDNLDFLCFVAYLE